MAASMAPDAPSAWPLIALRAAHRHPVRVLAEYPFDGDGFRRVV
jgi:hypothetical protein